MWWFMKKCKTFKDLGITNACEYCGETIPIDKYAHVKYCCDYCRHATANLREYGMTPKDLRDRLEAQGHVCKVCERECKLYIDHCHMTGVIRGLICQKCNSGIGFLGDNYDTVKRALDYLDTSRGPGGG